MAHVQIADPLERPFILFIDGKPYSSNYSAKASCTIGSGRHQFTLLFQNQQKLNNVFHLENEVQYFFTIVKGTEGDELIESSKNFETNLPDSASDPVLNALKKMKNSDSTNCVSSFSTTYIQGVCSTLSNLDQEPARYGVAQSLNNGKCISVEQLKSIMKFLSRDDHKFQFVQDLYPRILDREHLSELIEIFHQPDYVDKMKELAQKNSFSK